MTRIILHIGGEKTGSSYLQRFLHRNASALLRKHRILYPKSSALLHRQAHFPLVASLLHRVDCDFMGERPSRPAGELFARLDALIASKRPEIAVLSAEHFSSRLERPVIAALAERLAKYQVSVVFYVRRQDELAISRLSTTLKCGERDWLCLDDINPDNRYYNPLQVIDDWRAVFGAEAVQVRSYASATAVGLAHDFLSLAGLERSAIADLHQILWVNEKISLSEARVLHQLNQCLPTWREAIGNGRVDQHTEAMRLRCKLLDWLRKEQPEAHPIPLGGLLSWQQREQMMQSFDEVNRILVERDGLPASDFMLSHHHDPHPAEPPVEEALADAVRLLGQHLLLTRGRHHYRLKRFARSTREAVGYHLRSYFRPLPR